MERPEAENTFTEVESGATPGILQTLRPPNKDSSVAEVRHDPAGRQLYSWDELPPKVRLRAEHEGKWVAWSADGESIVASAEQFEDLHRAIKDLKTDRVIYDWIDLPHRQFTGL